MIKILLCCGGGFSSSAIATRMEKEIKENISVRCRSIFRIVSLSGCALILFYPFNNRFQLFMIFECIIQLIWHLIVQYQLFRQKNM